MFYSRRLASAGVDFVSVSKGGKFEDAKQPRVGEAAGERCPLWSPDDRVRHEAARRVLLEEATASPHDDEGLDLG